MSLKTYLYKPDQIPESDLKKLYKKCLKASTYQFLKENTDPFFQNNKASYFIGKIEKTLRCAIIYQKMPDGIYEIWLVLVDPAYWGRGLSDEIMKKFYYEVLKPGERAELEVSFGNQAALKLYRRNHWSIVRRRKNYYSDGSDAIILQRKKEEAQAALSCNL